MSYRHLTSTDRARLAALRRAGHSNKEIAYQLGVHPATIGRELQRNAGQRQSYNANTASQKNAHRRMVANQRLRKLIPDSGLMRYVLRRLKHYWSPEQIAGRLAYETGRHIVSHPTIYALVRKHKRLAKYLRCQKPYRHHYGTRQREQIREQAKKRGIDERPEIVATRSRLGDWEGDTVVGRAGEARLLTYTERKSGLAVGAKVPGGKGQAEALADVTTARFKRFPKSKRLTVTYDNGVEFSDHEHIETTTGMTTYFAHPYHSWERGSSENTNGLYRQFFPKKQSLDQVSQAEIDKVTRLLNTRPRKRLHYRTPVEVFRRRR